ncbi:hypothetical protein H6P81_004107 [Aristolochia fimbriata]|uniref:Secreted protein n=1 Tax=Aristolochia fimbriata TaxID=158543 RepID=A0AAV7FEY6_ARIFI|nr:hypothetical protein H6P81_004107 [Aristolochia fimbriata]
MACAVCVEENAFVFSLLSAFLGQSSLTVDFVGVLGSVQSARGTFLNAYPRPFGLGQYLHASRSAGATHSTEHRTLLKKWKHE